MHDVTKNHYEKSNNPGTQQKHQQNIISLKQHFGKIIVAALLLIALAVVSVSDGSEGKIESHAHMSLKQ